MKERAIQIKTPKGWKVAGKLLKIKGEWCFYREVSSYMKFRQFDAWSIQSSVVPVLVADGVKKIYQWVRDEKQMLVITLDDFMDKSVERDFGEGGQHYVSAKYFTEVKGMKPVKRWISDVELVA